MCDASLLRSPYFHRAGADSFKLPHPLLQGAQTFLTLCVLQLTLLNAFLKQKKNTNYCIRDY